MFVPILFAWIAVTVVLIGPLPRRLVFMLPNDPDRLQVTGVNEY